MFDDNLVIYDKKFKLLKKKCAHPDFIRLEVYNILYMCMFVVLL